MKAEKNADEFILESPEEIRKQLEIVKEIFTYDLKKNLELFEKSN